MPDNSKNKNEILTRFEKLTKSIIESDHPILEKVRKEIPNLRAKHANARPWKKYLFGWNERFKIVPKLTAFIIALGVTFLIFHKIMDPFLDYQLGDTAKRHLIADKTIEIIDDETTAAKKQSSFEAVLTVYDYDRRIFFETTDRIQEAFQSLRTHLFDLHKQGKQLPSYGSTALYNSEFFITEKKNLSDSLNIDISDDQFEVLLRLGFNKKIEKILVHLLSRINLNLIVAQREALNLEKHGITISRIGGAKEAPVIEDETIRDLSSIIDLDSAKKQLEAEGKTVMLGEFSRYSDTILRFAKKLIVPNLTLNKQETEKRRAAAIENIKPVIIKINKGESILRYSEPITKRHLVILKHLIYNRELDQSWFRFFITAIFLFIMIYSLYSFISEGFHPYHYTVKDVITFSALLLLSIFLIRGIQFLAMEALIDKFPQVPFDFYYYLIPVSFGAVIIRMLTAKEPALIFSILLALVGGILLERHFFYSWYILATSLVATTAAKRVKTRNIIYWAGLITGTANVFIIVCIVTSVRNIVSFSVLIPDLQWIFWAGMLSGLLTSVFVVALIPVVELVSGHTTDLRLLELANMNHPLLKDLMVKAPGTYHHSMVIGSLVESAAEAIGANPLLARVMAYYHDVGKMERPLYFIENQAGGYNRHDALQPHMSALIIREHVKRGQELGKKYKLPQPILDAMSEHHGTSVISYFYNKAKSSSDDPEGVLASDYQYDGQKPQSKETALVMLGDVVEAATRSIADPTPLRLSGVVKNVLNKYFAEGQLSECDLTLRDLDLIAKSFLDVLLGIYHARIEYGISVTKDLGFKKKAYASTNTKTNSRGKEGSKADAEAGVTPIANAVKTPRSGSSGSDKN